MQSLVESGKNGGFRVTLIAEICKINLKGFILRGRAELHDHEFDFLDGVFAILESFRNFHYQLVA